MEENVFSLRSISATWLSTRPTSWVIEIILSFLCGLGLFFLLLPCFSSNLSSPPPRKHRNIRKRHTEPRGRSSRTRKKSGALRACRDCLKELEEARGLVSLLQSHLGKLPDKGGFHQLSCEEPPGKVCKTAPAGVKWPCQERVEEVAPTVSLLASPAPLSKHTLPLASTLRLDPVTSSVSVCSHSSLSASWLPEPFLPLDSLSPWPLTLSPPLPCPPDSEACPPPPTASSAPRPPDSILTLAQCDSRALPLGTVPQSSSLSASPVPAISDLGCSRCPISALSWWQGAAKALCFMSSSQCNFQQEHLSHHPPGALFWEDPTNRQVEASNPSLLSCDDQKPLEIQVTKRVENKIWKEKETNGSYTKQMNPEYHMNYLGNMLKSLGAEQDTTTPQPFWSTKGKPEQLPGPQQLSYPNVLGNHLWKKYNQLFWGLPSLHSESLVATAWISESSSVLRSPSFLFNGISNACPVQMQAKISPVLSQSQPLSHLEVQSQPLIPSVPQYQPPPLAQVQTHAHLQSSPPILPLSSPPQIRACGISCPAPQNKTQSIIPAEIQHPEWSLLQKQLESGGALDSVVKRSREVSGVFTSSLPQDCWVVSILPENFPISPELQEQLEQHLKKWLMQHQWELPCSLQESLELRQFQDKLPGSCQVKGRHGPSQPSSFTGERSKDAQKVGFQLNQDLGKGLGHILGKVPKDLSRGSESSLVKFWEVNSEESERGLKLSRSNSGRDLLRNLDKNLESFLKAHLSRKLGQISEGLIPVSVRRSWLAVNASPKSDTQMETRSPGILKGLGPSMNTSPRISFLRADTREVLEAHITRFWVRHRWGLPLKVLKSVNVLKLKKAQLSPVPQSAFPSSATCVSGAHSMIKFAEFWGKPPQVHPGEKMVTEESVSTLLRPLLAPSLVCEEVQRAQRGTPSGDNCGPLKTSLTGQQGSPPSQSLTLSLVGRTWQRGTVMEAERGSLEPSPSLAMARNEPREESGGWASQDPCSRVTMLEMNLGSQSLRAKDTSEAAEAKESPDLQPQSRVILGTNVLTKSQTINVHMRNLEAPGTSKSVLLPRMSVFQDSGKPCLNTIVVSELKSKLKVQSENQSQDCPTHMLPAADSLASQVPQCNHQKVPTGDRPPSQKLCGLMAAQRSSRGQQDPKISKLQDSWKSQSKMIAPTYKREGCRRPNIREHEEKFELWNSQATNVSHPMQVRGMVNPIGSKRLQLKQEKQQGPLESPFRKRMRLFFQWIFPPTKAKGQAVLQKCKPISAIAQNQGSVKSRSIMDSETAEAQALMTAVGQILEEKMATHHGLHATKLTEHKREPQAPVCGCSCCHRLPLYAEQGRMMSYIACNRQATSKGQSCSVREKQVRHRQSLKSVRFNEEQLSLRCLPSLPPKKTFSPVSPCKYGPRMPGAPGCHQHCPRHCLLRVGVFPGQPSNASLAFAGRRTCLQEKLESM
uniref:Spermatogenesis-associated protein 31E1-like n=1 Tax=Equus asinus TaxID=9793 RepID=A0A8C4LZV7_EQUAS|nr:spermatogenesis-associated protein 31A6-like [Equus asinus]